MLTNSIGENKWYIVILYLFLLLWYVLLLILLSYLPSCKRKKIAVCAHTNRNPNKQEAGFIFVWSGSELLSSWWLFKGLSIDTPLMQIQSGPTVPLKEVDTRFLTSDFFHKSVSPGPLSIPLGPFQIFSKFAEIFANECLTAVSTTPAKKEKNLEINFFLHILLRA